MVVTTHQNVSAGNCFEPPKLSTKLGFFVKKNFAVDGQTRKGK